ncbi:MAG TPA: hypothetical protein VFA17_05545 [Thermoplasmata archaeon]|nr:hypothetical protein [Thermoplasmata archaeon]
MLTLRARYKGAIGDWFDLLLLSPEDLVRFAQETGWDLVRVLWEGGPGDYIGGLERR